MQSFSKSFSQPASQLIGQSVSQIISQVVIESVRLKSVGQSVSQSVSWLVGQSVSGWSVGQPVSQSVGQSVEFVFRLKGIFLLLYITAACIYYRSQDKGDCCGAKSSLQFGKTYWYRD